MPARAKILSSKILLHSRVFNVRRDKIIEPGSLRSTRDIVVHSGSVVVLPMFDDGRMMLIRQYRHAVGGYLWELVAGGMEPGEPPLAGAKRELAEETGYTARRWRKLLDVFPTPGFVSERMIVYLAQDLRAGKARPEDDERITARTFSFHEMDRWIRSGKLRDAKSIASILFYLLYCQSGRKS